MIRTGLKTKAKKIFYFIKYPYDKFRLEYRFPQKKQPFWKLLFFVITSVNELKDIIRRRNLGFLHVKPHPDSLAIWKRFLKYNPNNLGTWSQPGEKSAKATEFQLIRQIINLFKGDPDIWSGYVTSGATEANIFSAWMGRNYLQKELKINKICLIKNSFTHYSVTKAADLVGVPSFLMSVDRKTFTINPAKIEETLQKIISKGYRGFLIPLTLGYTQTGTNDMVLAILKIIKRVQIKYGIHCFVWVDAAINGMVLPFLKNDFKPLTSGIGSVALDFHKTAMSPIPSGLILYKKEYAKYIENLPAYLESPDRTLLGSRSGIPAMSMFYLINRLGKNGLKKYLQKSRLLKTGFLTVVKSQFNDIEIINEEPGISVALISKRELPKEFTYNYGLYSKKWEYYFDTGYEKLFIYKINFLPNS